MALSCAPVAALGGRDYTKRVVVSIAVDGGPPIAVDTHQGYWDFIHAWATADDQALDLTIDYGVSTESREGSVERAALDRGRPRTGLAGPRYRFNAGFGAAGPRVFVFLVHWAGAPGAANEGAVEKLDAFSWSSADAATAPGSPASASSITLTV